MANEQWPKARPLRTVGGYQVWLSHVADSVEYGYVSYDAGVWWPMRWFSSGLPDPSDASLHSFDGISPESLVLDPESKPLTGNGAVQPKGVVTSKTSKESK